MSVQPMARAVLAPRRDEVSPIPHPLGFSTETPPDFDNVPGVDAQYDIGGVLFQTAASDDHPYQRQLQKVTKQQIDSSDNPGDNSLQDWWLRTQTDFSGGAGQEFMEPIAEDGVNRRFWSSAGVDVFSHPGRAVLLPSAYGFDDPELPSAGAITEHLARFNGGFISAGGTNVRFYGGVPGDTITGNQHTAGGNVEHLAVAGGVVLISMRGKVQSAPVGGGDPVDRYTGATGVPICAYAKNRTLVMADGKIWEVPGNPAVALDMATATPNVNMHDMGWTWVGAASTPTSILIAGNGAGSGMVMALTVDPQSGNLPTLAAPIVVAELPPGEEITAIATYLGTFAVLATTAGIRVGEITQSGGIQYGPLLGSPKMSGGSFSMWDRFAQYAVADAGDGRGGLVRLDLSELGKDGRVPWSTFTRISAERPVTAHVMFSGVSVAMLDADGHLTLTKNDGTPGDGWLETSQVRFGTLEAKNFQTVKVVTLPIVAGQIDVHTVVDNVTVSRIGSMTKATGGVASFRTGNRRSLAQMGLRFDWQRDGDQSPVLEAWSMRALPAIDDRGEQVLLPLMCFDFERTANGLNVGYEGYAWLRWKALVARITNGSDLQVKELNSGSTYVAVAEDCSFIQVAPGNRASGFGGIINLLLREAR